MGDKNWRIQDHFFPVHDERIELIGISENGEWLVSMSEDEISKEATVLVWNMQTRNLKDSFQIKDCSTLGSQCDVSSDGTRVVLQTEDGMIQLWDVLKSEEPLLVVPQEKRTSGPRWHNVWLRNNSLAIVTVSDEYIEEWDTSSGSCIQSQKVTNSCITFSREEIFNILSYPEGRNMNERDLLNYYEHEICYGGQHSYRKLATLDPMCALASCYCSKSQTLCVSNNGVLNIFHLYT